MNKLISRRHFLKTSIAAGTGLAFMEEMPAIASAAAPANIRIGLVTYQWGRDWDLPELIENCSKTGILGVELRVGHAHKVETDLTATQRAEVKKRFEDSPVICVGYGSNFEFHSPDAAKLRENIEGAKEYVKLCSDIGATGLKVKPNFLPDNVPVEKTIAQIAASLNELGKFAKDYDQQIRVEVHGKRTQELPNMKAIFDQVTEKNVKVCWNCNNEDLLEPGIEANFNMVKKWIGDTTHIRELNVGDYPYQKLFNMFAKIKNYEGWFLLEARTEPEDRVKALKEQVIIFNKMIAEARYNASI